MFFFMNSNFANVCIVNKKFSPFDQNKMKISQFYGKIYLVSSSVNSNGNVISSATKRIDVN